MSIIIAMIVTLLHLTYKKIYLYSVRYLRNKWYLHQEAQFKYKSLQFFTVEPWVGEKACGLKPMVCDYEILHVGREY